MIGRYRKKPCIVEAVRYDGHNIEEIQLWSNRHFIQYQDGKLGIQTLEGIMEAKVGDYIIKGVAGEFYPCRPTIFLYTYEEI